MNHEQHDHTENAAKESSTWPSCCITAKNGITQGKNHTVKSFFFFSKHYFHSEKHFNDTVENAVLLFFENTVPSSDEIVVHLR